MHGVIIWKFSTKNFTVCFKAEPEDSLDLSWDEDGSVKEGIESGLYDVFCAHIEIIYRPTGAIMGEDYLGQCIYKSPRKFMDHRECGVENRKNADNPERERCGSYFTDMISEAVKATRIEVAKMQQIRLRAA